MMLNIKCRDNTAILENIDCQSMENPLLLFMEVNHLSLDDARGINRSIRIRHKDIPLTFSLLGYTVIVQTTFTCDSFKKTNGTTTMELEGPNFQTRLFSSRIS